MKLSFVFSQIRLFSDIPSAFGDDNKNPNKIRLINIIRSTSKVPADLKLDTPTQAIFILYIHKTIILRFFSL